MNAELPPLVAPFRGERYAARDRFSARLAPPYDVLSPEDRARYAASDPHNIVHLILPEAPPGGDRYAHAGALLTAWREAKVLQPDPGASVYVVYLLEIVKPANPFIRRRAEQARTDADRKSA